METVVPLVVGVAEVVSLKEAEVFDASEEEEEV